jgi:hypothetical protein
MVMLNAPNPFIPETTATASLNDPLNQAPLCMQAVFSEEQNPQVSAHQRPDGVLGEWQLKDPSK